MNTLLIANKTMLTRRRWYDGGVGSDMDLIDLHLHSTCSDGMLSPVELVNLARENGLCGISLTDHDTVEGIVEAKARGVQLDLAVIAGIEVSTWYDDIPMHLLGYGFNPSDAGLLDRLTMLQQGRHERNVRIIDKLAGLGFAVDLAGLQQYAGRGQTGRPHIARMMVEKGMVANAGQAFARYLRRGGKAYVDRFKFPVNEAIRMISDAGGVAVLAHPATIDASLRSLPDLLPRLRRLGLDGIEVYYPMHSAVMVGTLLSLAESLGLLVTGGSDFHGDQRVGSAMVGSRKAVRVSARFLDPLLNTITRQGRSLGTPGVCHTMLRG